VGNNLNNTLKEELKIERAKNQERELYISEMETKFRHLKEALKEISSDKEILKIRLTESVMVAEALRLRAEEERKVAQVSK